MWQKLYGQKAIGQKATEQKVTKQKATWICNYLFDSSGKKLLTGPKVYFFSSSVVVLR